MASQAQGLCPRGTQRQPASRPARFCEASLTSQAGAHRRGAVAVWLVLCLSLIVAIVAVGVDGGRMLTERRHVQAAADAAALAAAADLYNNYTQNAGLDPGNTAQKAAQAAAAANGYANDGTNSVVTVNIPPQSGPFKGRAEFVEVIVQSNLPATFAAGLAPSGLTVTARAVARGRPQYVGVILLQASGPDAFSNQGGSVQVVNASITVDSSDNKAFSQGKGAIAQAGSFEIVGGYSNAGTMTGTVHTGVAVTPDPLRNFPTPSAADYTVRSTQTLYVTGTTTLQPGIYEGGIQVSGQAVLTLSPGVYILDGGGIQVTGGAAVSGDGVMLYNTSITQVAGPVALSGGGKVTLKPPTTGPWAGISIFQDRSLTATVTITGNGNTQLTGAVYAAGAAVQLSGNGSGDTLGGGYTCASLAITGNGSFTVNPGTNRPKLPEVRRVE